MDFFCTFLIYFDFYNIDPLFALIVNSQFQKKIIICLDNCEIDELVNLYKTLLKVQLNNAEL